MTTVPPVSLSPGGQGPDAPRGDMITRTLAMPADANPIGGIFGGWVLGQMDVAGGIAAAFRARGRVATIGVTSMTFHKPVRVGDVVSCYCEVERVGTTSVTVHIEVWVLRASGGTARHIKVTEGAFTYVALDDQGQKRPVPRV